MRDEGQSALTAFIAAFERVNGRPPTAAENREALALVEVVRAAKLDPFLIFYLANKRAQDALERIPLETQSVFDEGVIKLTELFERAIGDSRPLPDLQRSASLPHMTTKTASSPELASDYKRIFREHSCRNAVTLHQVNYREFIVAYLLATATIAFTTWAVNSYSLRVMPALIVIAAFVSGVAGTSVLYEVRHR